MLFIAVEPRPLVRRHKLPVDPQVGISLTRSPGCQIGVVTLPRKNQGGCNFNFGGAELTQDLLYNLVYASGLNGNTAVRTELGSHTQKQQPDKVIQLGDRCHGTLPSTPACPLFNSNGWGNPNYTVHLRPGGGLNKLTGIGVQ